MDAEIIKLKILCLLFLVLVIFLFALRSIPLNSLASYISPTPLQQASHWIWLIENNDERLVGGNKRETWAFLSISLCFWLWLQQKLHISRDASVYWKDSPSQIPTPNQQHLFRIQLQPCWFGSWALVIFHSLLLQKPQSQQLLHIDANLWAASPPLFGLCVSQHFCNQFLILNFSYQTRISQPHHY